MRLLIAITALGIALSGVTSFAAGDAKAGKTVFDSKCKTCHGADGAGNAALAKTMKVTFKALASTDVQGKSDADLKNDIAKGTGKMQPVKGLTDKQTDDVIAYLRTLKS